MHELSNVIVAHPAYLETFTCIEALHQAGMNGRRPENLRLYGASGTGKTTLLRYYEAAHPARLADNRTIIPVAYVVIPSQPTPKQFVGELLRALHLPTVPKGTLTAQIHQFLTLAVSCGLELLLVDEGQHFVDRGNTRSMSAVADLLKVIIERLGVPTVFAGAPRMEQLFASNMQLRRRFYMTKALCPFNLEKDFQSFRGFIYELTAEQFPEADREFLVSADIATRLFYATDGLPGNIADLFRTLQRVAMPDATVNRAILSLAFRNAFYPKAKDSANPFTNKFRFERLTKPGEPFEPSQLDGDNHFGRFLEVDSSQDEPAMIEQQEEVLA